MIKCAIPPIRRGVALVASLRESCRNVVRIRSALVILQMALGTCAAGELVVVVDVALCAGERSVRASQRKARSRVIKGCRCPVCSAVARLAGLRESGGSVRRICGAVEIGEVATRASGIRRRQVVIAIHVALRALQRRVRPGQREAGGRVIECCIAP